jgi:hypothetical protein
MSRCRLHSRQRERIFAEELDSDGTAVHDPGCSRRTPVAVTGNHVCRGESKTKNSAIGDCRSWASLNGSIVLVMAEAFRVEEAPRESQTLFSHAEADARFGASVFWVRRGLLLDGEMASFLDFWQTRRDGVKRGIVEVQT